MLRRIAIAAAFLFAAVAGADAMNFSWSDQLTVHASGPIEEGDAAKFAALPKYIPLPRCRPNTRFGPAIPRRRSSPRAVSWALGLFRTARWGADS